MAHGSVGTLRHAIGEARWAATHHPDSTHPAGTDRSEAAAQADLLRDVFGNPFRPAAPEPAWLTPAVVQLAQSIYDDRAFDFMPVLGDALKRAGCDNSELLSHCRTGVEHVRGCWVVELVLGKR